LKLAVRALLQQCKARRALGIEIAASASGRARSSLLLWLPVPVFGRAMATRGACAAGFCALGRWAPAPAPRLNVVVPLGPIVTVVQLPPKPTATRVFGGPEIVSTPPLAVPETVVPVGEVSVTAPCGVLTSTVVPPAPQVSAAAVVPVGEVRGGAGGVDGGGGGGGGVLVVVGATVGFVTCVGWVVVTVVVTVAGTGVVVRGRMMTHGTFTVPQTWPLALFR